MSGKLKQLPQINHELAWMAISADEGEALPDWRMVAIVQDLPRLAIVG